MVTRCIIVVGPYRSGTSVTAGVLHHLGVDMGAALPPGDAWNMNGSFCDMALHYHLLELYHHAPGAIDRVKGEIERRSRAPHWGLKDHKIFGLSSAVGPGRNRWRVFSPAAAMGPKARAERPGSLARSKRKLRSFSRRIQRRR
jgi:hypothetical protein